MIHVACRSCAKKFKFPDEHAGKTGKCPGCGTTIKIPQATVAAAKTLPVPKSVLPTPRQPTKAEADNIGTRQDSVQKADTYWTVRQMKPEKEPYLLYFFPSAGVETGTQLVLTISGDAREAASMSRTAKIAPGGLVYHVLNRSVAGLPLSRKEKDSDAFERVMVEAHERHPTRMLACASPKTGPTAVTPGKTSRQSSFDCRTRYATKVALRATHK